MAEKKTLPPLRQLRIALEVGLQCLSCFYGERWGLLPILDISQGLRFCRTVGYAIPDDARERIRGGAIVTLVETKERT